MHRPVDKGGGERALERAVTPTERHRARRMVALKSVHSGKLLLGRYELGTSSQLHPNQLQTKAASSGEYSTARTILRQTASPHKNLRHAQSNQITHSSRHPLCTAFRRRKVPWLGRKKDQVFANHHFQRQPKIRVVSWLLAIFCCYNYA